MEESSYEHHYEDSHQPHWQHVVVLQDKLVDTGKHPKHHEQVAKKLNFIYIHSSGVVPFNSLTKPSKDLQGDQLAFHERAYQ